MARKQQISKIQQHLKNKELAMVNPDSYKARCKVELSAYRNVKTATDVVNLGQTAINSLIADSDGDVLDIKKATALGYLMAIQLTAIKMAKSEQSASDGLSDKIHDSTNISMTKEELKRVAYATNINFQLNVINRAIDRPETPRIDFIDVENAPPILKTAIINAVNDVNGVEDKSEEADILNKPHFEDHINEDDEDFDHLFESKDKK